MNIQNLPRIIFALLFVAFLNVWLIVSLINHGPALAQDLSAAIREAKNLGELKTNLIVFEGKLGENSWGKTKFIDAYAYLQRLMGKEETDNFWAVRDLNGTLSFASFYPYDIPDVEECARRTWRLKASVEKKGTRVFFINSPARYVRNKFEFSPGLPYEDNNYLQDAFLYHLQRYGIDYVDIRTIMSKYTGILPEDYFFRTDHHWRVETAFEVFTDIISWMEDFYKLDLDPGGFYRDRDNYNYRTYHNAFLGSMGRRTGANFSGFDDFTVIWPRFDAETDITFDARFLEEDKTWSSRGTITGVLMYPFCLSTEDPYMVDFYAVYQGGLKPSDKIINHKNPGGPKLLLIRDSYMLPLGVFMAPMFSEIHMIWPLNDEVQIDIESYLEENTFDVIIIEMYERNLHLKSFYFFPDPLE